MVTILASSPIHVTPVPMLKLIQSTGHCISVSSTLGRRFSLLIAHQILTGIAPSDKLPTLAGRRELRSFVVEQLLPRLR